MKNVFISSTFKDMQRERDLLNTKVLPLLNEEARENGDEVFLCDLRWGINTANQTEQDANVKILSTCLGEIDNCRPYMIVFLGERYGWIPSEKLMRYTVTNNSKLTLKDYNLSVTALEIEYGAFYDEKQLERTLFYFRNTVGNCPEYFFEKDSKSKQKLINLKERIKNTKGALVYEYTVDFTSENSLEESYLNLENSLRENLINLFKPSWEKFKNLTPYSREVISHLNYAMLTAEKCYDGVIKSEMVNFFIERGLKFMPVCSSSGQGTTTALCKLATKRMQRGITVLPIFCGVTKNSCDEHSIAKTIALFLGEKLQIQNEQTLRLIAKSESPVCVIKEYLHKCASLNYKIEIIVDGVDLLNCTNISELSFFLPKDIPDNFTFIFSASKADFFNCPYHKLISVTECADYFSAVNIINKMLANTRKEIDESVLKEIFYKSGSHSPLYLQMILKRLSLMEREDYEIINQLGGDINAISNRQIQIIRNCPDTLVDLCVQIANKAGKLINEKLCDFTFKLIALSKYGVSEKQLMQIAQKNNLPWDSLDFKTFIQYLNGIIYMAEGGVYKMLYPSLVFKIDNQEFYYKALVNCVYDQDLSGDLLKSFIYWAIKGKCYQEYLTLLLCDYVEQKELAQKTANEIISASREEEYSNLQESWIEGILQTIKDKDEKDAFYNFFVKPLNNAFNGNRVQWRKMAYVAFKKDWNKVNKYETHKDEKSNLKEIESYLEEIYNLKDQWKKNENLLLYKPRKERLIIENERKNQIVIDDKTFYFFNVPTKKDCALYLMCNEYVLLTFLRSSVGDHCTYDISYDAGTKTLTVKEADFCHYDIETVVTTFTFYDLDKKIEDIKYTSFKEDFRGNKTLPIFFPIKN